MPTGQRPHPDVERLTAFALGKLELAEIDALETHMAGCPACCQTIKQIQDDTFTSLVRDCQRGNPTQQAGGTEAVTLDPATPNPEAAPPVPQRGDFPTELVDHPRYRLVKLLGSGGMGAVNEAQHRRMQRHARRSGQNPGLRPGRPEQRADGR